MNKQLPLPIAYSDLIDIVGAPFLTIQGEGPYAGMATWFIRLHGCNLQCPGCDTNYTAHKKSVSVDQLIQYIEDENHNRHANVSSVVITGGEPFRQKRVYDLIEQLITNKFQVHIETNGSLGLAYVRFPIFEWVAEKKLIIGISPKSSWDPAWASVASFFKVVVEKGDFDKIKNGQPINPLGGLEVDFMKVYKEALSRKLPIFVQPADHRSDIANRDNITEAIAICNHFGYVRLSVQIHKMIGLP